MKSADRHAERRKNLHHFFLGRISEELLETREAQNFIKKDRAALGKAGTEERFLSLIRNVKEAEKFVPKLFPYKKHRKTVAGFDESLRLELLRSTITEIINAILKGDDDFFLKFHHAIRFKQRDRDKWRITYITWAILKRTLRRNPTCRELCDRLIAPPINLKIENRTVLEICRNNRIPLSPGRPGRPKLCS